MVRTSLFACVLAAAAPLEAQALPDLKVLTPDGYDLFIRADAARIQQSEFWRVFSHSAMVKEFLEKQLPEHLGFEVEDLKRAQVAVLDGPGGESVSMYLEGTADLKAERIVETAQRHRGEPVEPATVAGRKAWILADDDHGPSVTEFGPGMVWMASPGRFVRERLEVIQKSNPHKPAPIMQRMFGHEAGALFLANCNPHFLRLLNNQCAEKAGTSVTGMWCQVDFQPDLVVRAGALIADGAKAEAMQAAMVQAVGEMEQQLRQGKRAGLADQLKKIVLKVDRDEITTEIRIDKKDVSTIAQGVGLFFTGLHTVTEDRVMAATVAEPESRPAPAQSKPAGK